MVASTRTDTPARTSREPTGPQTPVAPEAITPNDQTGTAAAAEYFATGLYRHAVVEVRRRQRRLRLRVERPDHLAEHVGPRLRLPQRSHLERRGFESRGRVGRRRTCHGRVGCRDDDHRPGRPRYTATLVIEQGPPPCATGTARPPTSGWRPAPAPIRDPLAGRMARRSLRRDDTRRVSRNSPQALTAAALATPRIQSGPDRSSGGVHRTARARVFLVGG